MATNPIIHNEGGIHRFQDYMSQIPEFLKGEDDVVSLLQVLSDYLNNAYRNIERVSKFEFKLITTETRVILTIKKLEKLANLLTLSSDRGLPIQYLSKPISNPLNSNNYFLGIFDYSNKIENLDPSIINIDKKDGDRVYINFTKETEQVNSGVYVYNQTTDKLLKDPYGTTQDPFLSSPNRPIQTVGGLAPRILEFKASKISKVKVRKAKIVDTTVYYEVFFNATIDNIKDVSSIYVNNVDEDKDGTINYNYLVDYYNTIDTLPNYYRYKYNIQFDADCSNFDWSSINTQGKGLFYANELTQYGKNTQIRVKDNNNKYIDPIYNENKTEINIKIISRDANSIVTVTTLSPHTLNAGERFNILLSDSNDFDGVDLIVQNIININQFTFIDPNISNPVQTGNTGKIVINNLFFNRKLEDPKRSRNLLNVIYKELEGTTEFQTGDVIHRIKERDSIVKYTFKGVNVNPESDHVVFHEYPILYNDLKIGDKVVVRRDPDSIEAITVPNGMIESVVYEIVDFPTYDAIGTKLKLKDLDITSTGTGKFQLMKLNTYFNANSDVDINENTIIIHHNDESNLENPIDPLKNITVGTAIRFNGLRQGSSISLPGPLIENFTYHVLSVDTETKKIKLTLDGISEIDFTSIGSGIIDCVLYDIIRTDYAKVEFPLVDIANDSGTIVLSDTYKGDFISEGLIAKVVNNNIVFIAEINSTSVPWYNDRETIVYKKGTHVSYNGKRYLVLNSIQSYYGADSPDIDYYNYKLDMDFTELKGKVIQENPYMVGMYDVQPLGFEELPDYESGYANLSNKLYITKTEDLELKYGHDQREWLFNPKQATKLDLVRNGYLEIVNNKFNDYDPVDGTIDNYIKSATTEYSLLLYELEMEIETSITSLTYNAVTNLVTGITATLSESTNKLNRLKTGLRVVVSGANQSEYNGIFKITVNEDESFSYTPLTIPSVNTATGTFKYNFENKIFHEISEILVLNSTTVQVETFGEHGFRDGITVNISGTDDAVYQGYYVISDVSSHGFKYQVPNTALITLDPDTSLTATVSYQPVDGDYINVLNDPIVSQNGFYIARNGKWEKYDDSKILNNSVFFTRQNLFDVTKNNPAIAKGDEFSVASMTFLGNGEVSVSLYEDHDYIAGTVINIKNASLSSYNGRYQISQVLSSKSFKYLINTELTPNTPAIALPHKKITCQSDRWYKYNISDISWQKKSNSLVYQTSSSNTTHDIIAKTGEQFVNNVGSFTGEYSFTYTEDSGTRVLKFKENDIVNLSDQLVQSENTKYRVKKGKWQILDIKLVAKVTDITVEYTEADEMSVYEDDPVIYNTYGDSDVNEFIDENFSGNLQLFKIENMYVSNYKFTTEKVENIDTIGSHHKQYNAKFDKNSVVLDRSEMSSEFTGVDDLKYPMIEKIERLVYLKDPNVIDFEFISKLAKYMGYDVTLLLDDISESSIYKTDHERNMAIRKTIQNLPQFYALKGTKSGLDAMLLVFGIVGKIVTLWTDANDPYKEFVPDYLVRDLQYTRMLSGINTQMVPTPHFKIDIDIEGNFQNQTIGEEIKRLKTNINTYKPIKTVFDGIVEYIKDKAVVRIFMGSTRSVGRMQCDIGFTDLDFDYGSELNNDCI